MDEAVLAEAMRLSRARRAFALATVVWRRAPSSGRVGSKGIVLPDGTVHGWLGGACAEPTVVRESIAALADERPRLLFLGTSDELRSDDDRGRIVVPMACESEGALEVYVEPFLPRPQLVVIGRSPAVRALTVQARSLEWDVAVVDDGGRADEHPYPDLVRTTLDLSGLDIGRASAVVVATQGHYDDLALRAALATEAGYIGVVAAGKRAAALEQLLRDEGFDDAQLARIQAPAGIDLGAVDNAEIAVAVLAELVALRAAGHLRATGTTAAYRETKDPVCGMIVFVETAKYRATYEGTDYWFCSSGCQRAFESDPAAFVRES